MDALQQLYNGLAVIMNPGHLYLCFIGTLIGTLIGVLPGIGPLATLSLLLPITLTLDPVGSTAMLAAIFYGAMYGGAITSILINIPGEAASVVTTLDGHAMARQGRAGAALGMAAFSSFIGGSFALILLTFFSPWLAEVAIRFGPPEYAGLMLLGLVCTLLMIQGSAWRGLTMMALGFLMASIGIDIVNGTERFTFGSINLTAGIDLLAVVIGLFGVSEILLNVEESLRSNTVTGRIRNLLPTRKDWRAALPAHLRGSSLGFILGIIPGGGPITASFMAYAAEKRFAGRSHEFGTGRIEGVAGPEASNNSAVVSGMIPLLTLGIPGNAVTALLLGALIIQGVQPGPMLITQQPDIFWGVVASLFVGNVFLLILNIPMLGLWVQLLRVPYAVLFPLILLLALVGTFASNKNMFDLWVMLGFGVGGYVLRKLQYEMTPLVLAFVLAPLFEQSVRQALVMSPDGAMIFLQRPVSFVLIAVSVLLALAMAFRRKAKSAKVEGSPI
jgi:putative tricarboxylic transport membrane protein